VTEVLSFGALIGSLPVGSHYVFTANARGTDGSVLYTGSASGVAILKDQTITVLITAQQTTAPTPFKNSVPVIDSLLVSSTNVTPGATA
jgi:hypothetical protein